MLLLVYFTLFQLIASKLEPSPAFHELSAIALFFAMSWLIIGGFGIVWDAFGNFGPTSDKAFGREKLDAYYFSAITFTTLGYGDFAPLGVDGKILASVEAIMGATHMVAFFSIVLGRLRANTAKDNPVGNVGNDALPENLRDNPRIVPNIQSRVFTDGMGMNRDLINDDEPVSDGGLPR